MQPTPDSLASCDVMKSRLLSISLIASLLFIPCHAHATATDAIGQIMCNAVELMVGTTGKAICTINVIALGAGALIGKISWNKAMLVVLGIGLVFGAAGIVASVSDTPELQYGGHSVRGIPGPVSTFAVADEGATCSTDPELDSE